MQALSDFPPANETPTNRTALAGKDETDSVFEFVFTFILGFDFELNLFVDLW